MNYRSVKDSIRPVSYQFDKGLNLLLYGPSGVGKTYFAGTASTAGEKVLVLNCESGCLSLAPFNVETIDIYSLKDARAVYKYLANDEHDYTFIMVDSLSELQVGLIESIGDGKPLTTQQWGQVAMDTRNLIRAFVALPMSVCFVCQDKEVQDGDHVLLRPDLSGQVGKRITRYFDLVGYSHINDTPEGHEYLIGFVPKSDRVMAKDRTGKLGSVMPSDWGAIKACVFGDADPELSKIPGPQLEAPDTIDGWVMFFDAFLADHPVEQHVSIIARIVDKRLNYPVYPKDIDEISRATGKAVEVVGAELALGLDPKAHLLEVTQ